MIMALGAEVCTSGLAPIGTVVKRRALSSG